MSTKSVISSLAHL